MPRALRLILQDVAVHIIQRGHNGNACFRRDADYLVYLAHLRALADKYECALHAYCLMTNHVHLLLSPAAVGACTALIRDLGQRYVQYFNRQYERTGTLWEGRFRSCIAASATYVLACYRYIELNPVRAGMVDHPAAYLWSSHAVNAGLRTDPRITPHAEYLALSADAGARPVAYRALFDRPLDEPLLKRIRDATNAGYPLAEESFKSSVLEPLGAKSDRGKPGPKAKSPPAPYVVETRAGIGTKARR